MTAHSDFLRTGRRITPSDYWKFGRIFGQLGIWLQSGLVMYMIAAAFQWRGHGWLGLVGLLILAGAKNVWLFLYCRARNLIDDKLLLWLAAIAFDIVTFLVILPSLYPEYLHVTSLFELLGLHYALAFCLRWRSVWCYFSLLIPTLFFALAYHVGENPIGSGGVLAQLVLGLVFIAAAREALLRDTRRVEAQVAVRQLQDAAVVVVDAERAALLGEAIGIHRTGLSPLRRLRDALQLAGEAEAAALAANTGSEVRRRLEQRVHASQSMGFDAFIGNARNELVLYGIRVETGRLDITGDVGDETARAFIAFARDVAPVGHVLEIFGFVHSSRGDVCLEIDASGLHRRHVAAWARTGRVEIGSDQKTLLFHLG